MLTLQNAYRSVFFLFLLMCAPLFIHGDDCSQSFGCEKTCTKMIPQNMSIKDKMWMKVCNKPRKLTYYLYVEDFIQSFIQIPTSNVLDPSTTISSKYLAGRAPVYNEKNEKVGNCTASFLCMQNSDGIYTDISNYLSVDNGLVISWFTPTTLINLELDSIVHSMVTECIVMANTKIGFNPFYGRSFNMIVSSDETKIYFKLTEI